MKGCWKVGDFTVGEVLFVNWTDTYSAFARVEKAYLDLNVKPILEVYGLDDNRIHVFLLGNFDEKNFRRATPKELEMLPLIELGYVEL